MPRWMRVVRGMIGTGLTFAAGVGGVATLIAGVVSLFVDDFPLRAVFAIGGRMAVVSFILGVAFSGALALASRLRKFDLSIKRMALFGAGAGALFYVTIGVNGAFNAWNLRDAIANFALLTAMGGGAATAVALLARRAKSSPSESDETLEIGEGAAQPIETRVRDSEHA